LKGSQYGTSWYDTIDYATLWYSCETFRTVSNQKRSTIISERERNEWGHAIPGHIAIFVTEILNVEILWIVQIFTVNRHERSTGAYKRSKWVKYHRYPFLRQYLSAIRRTI
jgi:hypothetical protein